MPDIKLEWKGLKYKIEGQRVMRARRIVERNYRFTTLLKDMQNGTPSFSDLACTLAELINFAGGDVDEEEVHLDMFADGGKKNAPMAANLLLAIMMPSVETGEDGPKKNPTSKSKPSSKS